jgi:hypothetical protein
MALGIGATGAGPERRIQRHLKGLEMAIQSASKSSHFGSLVKLFHAKRIVPINALSQFWTVAKKLRKIFVAVAAC